MNKAAWIDKHSTKSALCGWCGGTGLRKHDPNHRKCEQCKGTGRVPSLAQVPVEEPDRKDDPRGKLP